MFISLSCNSMKMKVLFCKYRCYNSMLFKNLWSDFWRLWTWISTLTPIYCLLTEFSCRQRKAVLDNKDAHEWIHLEDYKRGFSSCGHLKWQGLEDLERRLHSRGAILSASLVDSFQSREVSTHLSVWIWPSYFRKLGRSRAGWCLLRHNLTHKTKPSTPSHTLGKEAPWMDFY